MWSLNCLVYSVATTLAEVGKDETVKNADHCVVSQMTRYCKFFEWLGVKIIGRKRGKRLPPEPKIMSRQRVQVYYYMASQIHV